jgi:hypothetical protein
VHVENNQNNDETWCIWCHVGIHVNFTSILHLLIYSGGPSSVVWSELGPGSAFFPPMRVLEVSWSRALGVMWGTTLRATSHMSQEPWPCNGEDLWLSSKGRTMGVGKAIICNHGPSSIVWSENGPCCGTIAYLVGGKEVRIWFNIISFNFINLREIFGGVCQSWNILWNIIWNLPWNMSWNLSCWKKN